MNFNAEIPSTNEADVKTHEPPVWSTAIKWTSPNGWHWLYHQPISMLEFAGDHKHFDDCPEPLGTIRRSCEEIQQINMSTTNSKRIVQPYLFFNGVCEQTLDFYRKAAGAEVMNVVRYKDSPEPAMCPPGAGEKIMRANVRIGETTLLASDGDYGGKPVFQGVSLALSTPDEADAERVFATLAVGGQIAYP